jgi:8-oxo-dGTP pyrophosphatase MutT (NUDIX family)
MCGAPRSQNFHEQPGRRPGKCYYTVCAFVRMVTAGERNVNFFGQKANRTGSIGRLRSRIDFGVLFSVSSIYNYRYNGEVDFDGELLLIKGPRRGWEMPGGQVEEGESLSQAALRETKEESGIDIEIVKFCGKKPQRSKKLSKTGDFMRTLIIFCLIFFISSCSNRNDDVDFNEIVKAQGYAEQKMREKGVVTATSSQSNDYVKFRLMTPDSLTNDEAKELVQEFITLLEEPIKSKDSFNQEYYLLFDIKSEKDGRILYNGKRDKGNTDLWWQF